MGGPAFDCLRNPLGVVRILFERAVAAAADPSALSKSDWGATEVFSKFVFENGGLSKLPEINSVILDSIAPNTLVRFRGMVQDMLDTEYYVGAYKDGSIWRTNKYTDVASFEMDPCAPMQVWDRRLLYCVPVPGENAWVREGFQENLGAGVGYSVVQRGKRPRDQSEATSETDNGMDVEVDTSNEPKRKREEETTSGSAMEVRAWQSNDTSPSFNMPFGDPQLLPCLVKVYDGPDFDIKLNDVVEFIGVFTFNPELTTNLGQDTNGDLLMDDVSNQLPSSKVPRLHCIISRKASVHKLPSLNARSEFCPSSAIKDIRSSLLQKLTNILGGDALAAQYLLLHIISKVHARVEPVAVGKFSLNLTGIGRVGNGASLSKAVADSVKELLPCSYYIPLTVEYLNAAVFSPKKNYETNRLIAGTLQLAAGTHLTIDETQLKSGTLDSNGIKNVRAFRNLLEWQKVEYDFQYYTMEMPADVQVLILSDGKSNIFPADLVLPCRPASDPCILDGTILEKQQWRQYLSMSKASDHTIEPAMQEVVENDMVEARQNDRSLGTDVFSRWLTMARLVSLSFGEKVLTMEHWQIVKDLEKQRNERIRSA